jgi:hypothetical protein
VSGRAPCGSRGRARRRTPAPRDPACASRSCGPKARRPESPPRGRRGPRRARPRFRQDFVQEPKARARGLGVELRGDAVELVDADQRVDRDAPAPTPSPWRLVARGIRGRRRPGAAASFGQELATAAVSTARWPRRSNSSTPRPSSSWRTE